jgi:hypothetical protein
MPGTFAAARRNPLFFQAPTHFADRAAFLSDPSEGALDDGGFFGRERGDGRKEIVGLLKRAGELYGRAPRHWDRRGPSGHRGSASATADHRTFGFSAPAFFCGCFRRVLRYRI